MQSKSGFNGTIMGSQPLDFYGRLFRLPNDRDACSPARVREAGATVAIRKPPGNGTADQQQTGYSSGVKPPYLNSGATNRLLLRSKA
jgi:hypothetical protein